MAIKRKRSRGGGGANWMDTYGDMVTLLLCFFVLLYSISTVTEDKWIALVRSFNPDAVATMTETPGGEGPDADPVEGQGNEKNAFETQEEIDEAIDQLYQALKQYAAESQAGGNIEVTRGDGYVFVAFNDAVFFDGESFDLRPDGEMVLAAFSEILSRASPYIDEVRVMGHTAQGNPRRPNRTDVDRFLSSNRATVATIYIQEHSTLDPARLVSMGYGQHRPVDTNDSAEGRSHNRRVEIVITGLNVFNHLGDSIQQYHSMREGDQPESGGAAAPDTAP